MKTNIGIIIGFSSWALSLVGVIFIWDQLPNQLPWLYSLPWGEKQLISRQWFLGGIAIVGISFSLNTLLSKIFSKLDEVMGTIIVWFGVVISVMYLTSVIRVLSLILKF